MSRWVLLYPELAGFCFQTFKYVLDTTGKVIQEAKIASKREAPIALLHSLDRSYRSEGRFSQ